MEKGINKVTYTQQDIHEIVLKQRKYFRSGATLDIKTRIAALKKLRDAVIKHETEIENVLYQDLGRSPVEAYLCDIGPTIVEINEMISGLKRWARPEIHFSGLMSFPSLVTKVYKTPYGVCLIISPFIMPFVLSCLAP